MFGWLFGKNEKDHGYIKPEGFTSGPHIPQPQPERRTRNPVAMPEPARMGGGSNVPKQEDVQPNISEPVITLLKMLERDEWEIRIGMRLGYSTMVNFINIYKEDVNISAILFGGEFKVQTSWMTKSEKIEVGEALMRVLNNFTVKDTANRNEMSRNKFAKLINVEV